MEEKNYTETVPGKYDGGNINAESTVTLENEDLAKALYTKARERLLDVNNWQELTGKALAGFQLTDQTGREVQGRIQKGLFFRIDIPGPGTETGEGYDWVQVEEVKDYQSEGIESIGIRVRPAPNPTNADAQVAHFYSNQATSTFTVTREKTKVTAAVYDRNTKANTDSDQLLDQVRNVVTGIAGIAAFSKLQWKTLTHNLIKEAH